MVMRGETIALGASTQCNDCHTVPELMVLESAVGHYIGTICKCGPYTRETHYMSKELAEYRLKNFINYEDALAQAVESRFMHGYTDIKMFALRQAIDDAKGKGLFRHESSVAVVGLINGARRQQRKRRE